jgi:hypothetical protein
MAMPHFIGEVIGRTCEGVDSSESVALIAPDQVRSHRKILVMPARQSAAGSISGFNSRVCVAHSGLPVPDVDIIGPNPGSTVYSSINIFFGAGNAIPKKPVTSGAKASCLFNFSTHRHHGERYPDRVPEPLSPESGIPVLC